MQYCSLRHRTLLLLLVTSTAECCFCFGSSIPLFFLELLHWSPTAYWAPTDLGVHLSEFYLFAFSCCSRCSQGKNTEVVCHSLLQWTTFCQTSPPWPIRLRWPYREWLSFIELDKFVVYVIILASFLWLWFQSVWPVMPSLNTYCLTGVSYTLDVGYLSMAAPAKHSRCSLPWLWGISSPTFVAPSCAAAAQSLYLDAILKKQNDLCSFPRQINQYHGNPSLCSDQ